MKQSTNTAEELKFLQVIKKRRIALKKAFTSEIIEILANKFQTNLPCFQGNQGSYDPLDAMRRDAHRELLLWVENEIHQYDKQNDD